MNLAQFQNSPSGRLVKMGQGETAYYAFAPHPLPPVLPLKPEMVRTLSDADRALGELAGLGRALPNPRLLIGPFIRREAVLSSRIEGTQTGIAELYAYEARQLSFPDLKLATNEADAREVLNYVYALEYGLERLPSLPVSLRLIREVHQRLMAGVRGGRAAPGEFRTSQNWIGRPGCGLNEAEYVPPPVAEMNRALGDLEKYLHGKDDYPPLVRLAFIHYQFEAIHPFLDGNGRIGRLLISLLLVHWGLLPSPLLYLSAFFEQLRSEYYDLLLAVSARGAWQEWVAFFLHGVTEQARDAISRARKLQDIQIEWRQHLQAMPRTSGPILQLVDHLFWAPTITTLQAQKMLGVTHRSASQIIARLVKEGILHPVAGRVRNRVFVAQRILEALSVSYDTLAP